MRERPTFGLDPHKRRMRLLHVRDVLMQPSFRAAVDDSPGVEDARADQLAALDAGALDEGVDGVGAGAIRGRIGGKKGE